VYHYEPISLRRRDDLDSSGLARPLLAREWRDIRENVVQPSLRLSPKRMNLGQAMNSSIRGIGGLGQVPTPTPLPRVDPVPRITSVSFRNAGGESSHPDNCCRHCPVSLGVGRDGTASNGMELQFTISGHRRGIEYDITRTRRNSFWERRAGVWTCLQSQPMGTRDDRHDADECLIPRSNRIFAIDTPGFPGINLPAPGGMRLRLLNGTVTHPDATDLVQRMSFAEWVIARCRAEGIPWTRLELPAMRDGTPRRFVFWHSIIWLTRDGSNRWVLDRARSRIAGGSLSAAIINSPPL
jgi:hypothetical protein